MTTSSVIPRIILPLLTIALIDGAEVCLCQDSVSNSAAVKRKVAIIVGISDYKNLNRLSVTGKHFDQLESVLRSDFGFTVKAFINEEATAESLQALELDLYALRPDDSLFIYFSGHAVLEPTASFAAYDAGSEIGWLPIEALLNRIAEQDCQKAVLFDTCHSGEAVAQFFAKTKAGMESAKLELLTSASNSKAHGGPAFLLSVVDNLKGRCNSRLDGHEFNFSSLASNVSRDVVEKTHQRQSPRYFKSSSLADGFHFVPLSDVETDWEAIEWERYIASIGRAKSYFESDQIWECQQELEEWIPEDNQRDYRETCWYEVDPNYRTTGLDRKLWFGC